MKIPKKDWVHYGFPGHFICASRCAYHLSTRVGAYLISTVGAFKAHHADLEYESLRADPDSLFETLVFVCNGEDEHGNPIRGTDELECVCYAKSVDAELGHRAMCDKYAQIEICGVA